MTYEREGNLKFSNHDEDSRRWAPNRICTNDEDSRRWAPKVLNDLSGIPPVKELILNQNAIRNIWIKWLYSSSKPIKVPSHFPTSTSLST
jgi:hypothetical protein